MATNSFVPFASGPNANVETDAQYQTDLAAGGTLATGFVAGLALSKQVNKVLRQSSLWSAVLGQIIADYAGADANDSQTTAALEASFLRALAAPPPLPYQNGSPGASGTYTVPAGVYVVDFEGISGGASGANASVLGDGGGGGGSGSGCKGTAYVDPGESILFTVGNPGAAPAAGLGNNGNDGGSGMIQLGNLVITLGPGRAGIVSVGKGQGGSGGQGGVVSAAGTDDRIVFVGFNGGWGGDGTGAVANQETGQGGYGGGGIYGGNGRGGTTGGTAPGAYGAGSGGGYSMSGMNTAAAGGGYWLIKPRR